MTNDGLCVCDLILEYFNQLQKEIDSLKICGNCKNWVDASCAYNYGIHKERDDKCSKWEKIC